MSGVSDVIIYTLSQMWLAETGHKRELDSLAVPQQHHGQS